MLSETLKARTQDIHTRVERIFPLKQLLQHPSVEFYLSLLQKWHEIYYHFSHTLNEVDPLFQKHFFYQTLINLEKDIDGLGGASKITHPTPMTPPFSDKETWGVLYVLYGSTLGSKIIARQLANSNCRLIRDNRRFFLTGEECALHWPTFKKELSRVEQSFDNCNLIIDSAIFTFEFIELQLCQLSNHIDTVALD